MGSRELKKYLQQSLQQSLQQEAEPNENSLRLEETVKLCTEMMREQKLAKKSPGRGKNGFCPVFIGYVPI